MARPRVVGPCPERIARRVAPDEIDIALDVTTAYAQGGAARRELFRPDVADPGSFSVGVGLLLPHVLQALDLSGALLRNVLRDPATRAGVSTGGLAVAHQQFRAARAAVPPRGSALAAFVTVVRDLRGSGLTHDEAEWVATGVFEQLALDPRAAVEFLDYLGAAGR